MAEPHQPELSRLFSLGDPGMQEAAWGRFLDAHSRLLLHVARSIHRDHDAAMDAYAYTLEQLRQDGFHRLRAYVADGRSKFTTWLVVVARRLCLDHHRHRYGRTRVAPDGAVARDARRRLVDLVAESVDPTGVAAPDGDDPHSTLEARERSRLLERALASLPSRDRLLLALRFEDDLSAREIAALVGMPSPFHVYRRLNAVLAALRRTLTSQGVDGDLA